MAMTAFVVLTVGLSELAAWVLLRASITGLPSRAEIEVSLEPDADSTFAPRLVGVEPGQEFMRQHVLHPYLGFVRNPELERHVFNSRVVSEPVNEFGFFGPSPLESTDAETLRIVITGGSVATDLYLRSSETLRKALQESPALAGKRIQILCLALGGMKQPQQLLALEYFLSLGARFDMVINLDGFNEIALPFAENIPVGLPVSSPRSWQLYTAHITDDRSATILAGMSETRRQIERTRAIFSGEPLRRSSLALILWDRIHAVLRSELLGQERRLRELLAASQSGPSASHSRSLEEVLKESVELWGRSSIQMWRICRSNGIVYVHVLQPNQYVEGSKPLDAREQRLAWTRDFPHRRATERGYPLLIVAGGRLKRLGVPFHNLTRIFAEEMETIYVDPCCHFNQRGNDMLASEIARVAIGSIEAGTALAPKSRQESEEAPAS